MEFFTFINTALLLAVAAQLVAMQRGTTGGAKSKKELHVVLDSCALIDGRIVDIVRLGFMHDKLVIPQSVVLELQYLADQGDSHKRERARFGLDVVRQLQDLVPGTIIDRSTANSTLPVDEQLIVVAKKYGGKLYTTDFNLNKVAQIHGVDVLNVNELSQQLRARILPGEKDTIKIVSKGQDKTQGVGYLEDGTMVVVERAGSKVGQLVSVEFSRVLQTQAGRMMFATMPQASAQAKAAPHPKRATVPQPQPVSAPVAPAQPSITEQQPMAANTAATPKKAVSPQKRKEHHAQKSATTPAAAPHARRRKPRNQEDSLIALASAQHKDKE